MNQELKYEVRINGDDLYNPIVSITIDNGFYEYVFKPEDIKEIIVRPMPIEEVTE